MTTWATLTDLTAWTSGTDDGKQMAIDAAQATIVAYCGWHIAPSKTETVVLSGSDTTVQMLPSLYVTAVASVDIDGIALVEDQDYTVHREGFLEFASPAWTSRSSYLPRVVTVEFTHGYADVPAELLTLVLSVAARTADSPGSLIQVGQVRYATGADGTAVGGMLTLAERDTLGAYRLPVLA